MHAHLGFVCMDVPLDGINNNKAKLRDSLITISRSHLTAGAIANQTHCCVCMEFTCVNLGVYLCLYKM